MLFEIQYNKSMRITKLSHAYRFPGFRPLASVKELSGEHETVIVPLKQIYQKKSLNAQTVVLVKHLGTIIRKSKYAIIPADDYGCTLNSILDVSSVRNAKW